MIRLKQIINPDHEKLLADSTKRIERSREKISRNRTASQIEKQMEIKESKEKRRVDRILSSKNHKVTKTSKNLIREIILETNRLEHFKKTSIELKIPRKVKTHREFVLYIMQINLFPLIFSNLKSTIERKSFPCCLIEGHRAWIDKDKQGHYRYFSKRMDDQGRSFSMSIFDLIQIVDGKLEFFHSRDEIIIQTNAKYPELTWEKQQRKKIATNLSLIKDFPTLARREYPSLHTLSKTHYALLELLHQYAHPHITMKHSLEKRHIFFASSQYLAEKYGKDAKVLNKAINLFAVLGLVQKERPDKENFPDSLLRTALYFKGDLKRHKFINFYSIPSYTNKLLREAEERAELLLKNGVRNFGRVTEKSVINVFGESFSKTIYFQKQLNKKLMYERADFNPQEGRKESTAMRQQNQETEDGDDPIPF